MTDIPKLTPTPRSELAVKELEELLNHLAAESLHTARSIANLQADFQNQLKQLTERSEQQWEQVQQLRRELETQIKQEPTT